MLKHNGYTIYHYKVSKPVGNNGYMPRYPHAAMTIYHTTGKPKDLYICCSVYMAQHLNSTVLTCNSAYNRKCIRATKCTCIRVFTPLHLPVIMPVLIAPSCHCAYVPQYLDAVMLISLQGIQIQLCLNDAMHT
jgi:hypothetical protein